MNIALVLNRVFRLEQNPMFEYLNHNQADIERCYCVIPLELFEDEAPLKRTFYHQAVTQFIQQLIEIGIKPFVFPYTAFASFCEQKEIDTVVFPSDIMSFHNCECDILHVKSEIQAQKIAIVNVRANHYFQPSRTLNQQGQPYKVFTSFYKANRPQLRQRRRYPYQLDKLKQQIINADNTSVEKVTEYINIGEAKSQQQWQAFLNNNIEHYQYYREYLPETLTSQLSIALAYGFLDINEIMRQLLERYHDNEENYEAFIRELLFREFYYVLMVYYPETAHTSFNDKYKHITWSENQSDFNAWKEGRTGYPIIDAAMHELKQTGFMHNRMRMVTAQFLTKELFIDWTWGENYFKNLLIDYDAASNVHGWQWSASTGTDAVPYFRMFNPIRQSERFDKKGLYIKTYFPQWANVPASYVHEPWKHAQTLKDYGIDLGTNYPWPIVDHQQARAHVMEQFKKQADK